MLRQRQFGNVTVDWAEPTVAIVEFARPPLNYVDPLLLGEIADAYEWCEESLARVIVVCSAGKHYCAGAQLSADESDPVARIRATYAQALRLFQCGIPVVAAVQGAAVGAGLGLACSADLRVAASTTRFVANFSLLGTHPGFGLTVTLPAIVGDQHALDLFYTSRPVDGIEARTLGLCDVLSESDDVRSVAVALATRIATTAPLAVRQIKRTLRGDLHDRVADALQREIAAQEVLGATTDHREGIAAMIERRAARFIGS